MVRIEIFFWGPDEDRRIEESQISCGPYARAWENQASVTASLTSLQFGEIQRLTHLANQDVPVERLLQAFTVWGDILAQRRVRLRTTGHEQDSDSRMKVGHAPRQGGAIQFRHLDVRQQQVNRSIKRSCNLDGLEPIAGR